MRGLGVGKHHPDGFREVMHTFGKNRNDIGSIKDPVSNTDPEAGLTRVHCHLFSVYLSLIELTHIW